MKAILDLEYLSFETQLGWIMVAATAAGVAQVDFLGPERPSNDEIELTLGKKAPEVVPKPASGSTLAGKVMGHFLEYLRNHVPLPVIPTDVRNGTDFERRIWRAISTIPFGETRSYRQIASAAGCPGGARAAGGACGRNPVPLIVPCHRVITASGKLGGFSGGLNIKRILLDLERSR